MIQNPVQNEPGGLQREKTHCSAFPRQYNSPYKIKFNISIEHTVVPVVQSYFNVGSPGI